jgi:hypothetical protein
VEQVSWGILNYVVMKPLMTALTLILQVWHKYGEGEFRPTKVKPFQILYYYTFRTTYNNTY